MDEIEQGRLTYPVVLRCENCGEDFGDKVVRVPKGTRRDDAYFGVCPRCGCKAIVAGTVTGIE